MFKHCEAIGNRITKIKAYKKAKKLKPPTNTLKIQFKPKIDNTIGAVKRVVPVKIKVSFEDFTFD